MNNKSRLILILVSVAVLLLLSGQIYARTNLYQNYCMTPDSASGLIDKFSFAFTKTGVKKYNLTVAQQDSTFTFTTTAIHNHPKVNFSTTVSTGSDTMTLTGSFVVSSSRISLNGTITVATTSSTNTYTFTGSRGSCPASATSLLPDISNFASTGTSVSDRFPVDVTYMEKGFPFKGSRARSSHEGAHIHVTNASTGSGYTWPDATTGKYLPIYAVADGIVASVDSYFAVDANYKYNIELRFANKSGSPVSFSYSIEPMTNPGDSDFYLPYIVTSTGSTVTKGDIIAYFYIPDGSSGEAHIHFHLDWNNSFYAPSIFTSSVVSDFHDHFGEFGIDQTDSSDPGVEIGSCMGYMISSTENIFGTGDVDCQ